MDGQETMEAILRKKLGLDSDCPPAFLIIFSHGSSVALPPSGKIYEVELLMGGASYRKEVFEKQQFSNYFEGYGMKMLILLDSKNGEPYLNTESN
jgi:hypothetical protein